MRLLPVMAIALGLLVPASVTARSQCAPRPHYRVIARSQQAVITETDQAFSDDDGISVYRGCAMRSGRSRILAKARDSFGSSDALFRFRVAGTRVAWVEQMSDRSGSLTYVLVEDVRSRGTLFFSDALHPPGGRLDDASVPEIVLDTTGHLAFVVRGPASAGLFGTAGCVDTGPAGSIADLRLAGGVLSWANAGVPRSLALGPPTSGPAGRCPGEPA